MAEKVLLVLVDGMRSDALCATPDFLEYYKSGTYCLQGRTVFPPVTLPAHMSLYHSVDPERHGVYNNIFVQQNHPIRGLADVLREAGKTSARFYCWEPLRDLAKPEAFSYSHYMNYEDFSEILDTDTESTRQCIAHIRELAPDFVFLYLHRTDEMGHDHGWMSEKYLAAVQHAGECLREVLKELPEDYSVIVTADHGGHGRNHGDEMDTDMTVPICFHGKRFPAGKAIKGVNIKDIAPTIAEILGVEPDKKWEGHSIFEKL